MMKSLYSGVAGMKTHNQRMDVIGNNISNVNTTAYKGSAVTFKDVYYSTKSQASAGDGVAGGVNPKQVGYGVSLGTINQVMTQSGFTYSDSVTDCAIDGEGFFQVMDAAGNILYTRNGNFSVDNAGNLVDPNGNIVLGAVGDPTNAAASTQRISLIIPDVDDNVASATKTVVGDYDLTITAAGIGPNGNIAISIKDGDSFATLNGNSLQVTMDLTQEFPTQQLFEEAVNEAIRAGGVNLPDNVIPLSISFSSIPAETYPIQASNVMKLSPGSTGFAIRFTSRVPGEFANAYNINLKTSATATEVSARWDENTLTITIPAMEDYGDETPPDITAEMIQDAIYKAAGVPDENALDPSDYDYDYEYNPYDPEQEYAPGGGTGDTGEPYSPNWELSIGEARKLFNVEFVEIVRDGVALVEEEGDGSLTADMFYNYIGKNTKKLSMTGGEDSFYARAVTDMATLKLENGRFQAPQTVQDLDLVFIDSDGTIYGEHAVHGRLRLGRIDVVTFENPVGLNQVGTSYWAESLASGVAQVKRPGDSGSGMIVSGALEMSNVDLSQEFSDMIITQRGFQANSRIITVSDTMLEELINLKR